MSASESDLARWWAPRCSGKSAAITLFGGGVVTVNPIIIQAVMAFNACLVVAGYRTRKGDTGAFVCRMKTLGNGWSLHAYKIAMDINWVTNPYGPRVVTDMPMSMIIAIEAIRTNNGKQVWSWGGRWSGNKDCMHFQIACSPADLATGIDPRTVPGGAPPAPAGHIPTPTPQIPFPQSQENDDMRVYFIQCAERGGGVWSVSGNIRVGVANMKALGEFQAINRLLGGNDAVNQVSADFFDSLGTVPNR